MIQCSIFPMHLKKPYAFCIRLVKLPYSRLLFLGFQDSQILACTVLLDIHINLKNLVQFGSWMKG